jgi:hypothetical protein
MCSVMLLGFDPVNWGHLNNAIVVLYLEKIHKNRGVSPSFFMFFWFEVKQE